MVMVNYASQVSMRYSPSRFNSGTSTYEVLSYVCRCISRAMFVVLAIDVVMWRFCPSYSKCATCGVMDLAHVLTSWIISTLWLSG